MNREFRGLFDFDLARTFSAPFEVDLSRRSLDNDLLFRSTGSDLDFGMAMPDVKQVARRLSNLSSSSSLLSLSLTPVLCLPEVFGSGLSASLVLA